MRVGQPDGEVLGPGTRFTLGDAHVGPQQIGAGTDTKRIAGSLRTAAGLSISLNNGYFSVEIPMMLCPPYSIFSVNAKFCQIFKKLSIPI